jgi:hypothetical protein
LANAATQLDGFWTQITGFSGLAVGSPITSRGDIGDFLSLSARL